MIIKDNFYIYKRNNLFSVELTSKYLKYRTTEESLISSCKPQNKDSICISVKDIIGCVLMKSHNPELHDQVYMTIYAYPLSKCEKKRIQRNVTFQLSIQTSYEKNFEVALTWRKLIYHVMYNTEATLESHLYRLKKKLLIFINPKSGPGTALTIFKKKVKSIFAEAEIDYDLVITDHSNHAYEMVQHIDLFSLSGLVVIAGDGLIYEVYNGLFQRSDRNTAIEVPIGIIPGGSGNGLASSIAHSINEPYLSNPVLVSTLNIVNPMMSPMDLILLDTYSGLKLISFLSIGFGLLADIDIESEKLRMIGEARFTVYGIARVFSLRKYRVRLSYKVAESALNNSTENIHFSNHLLRSKTDVEIDRCSVDKNSLKKQRSQSVNLECDENGLNSIGETALNSIEQVPPDKESNDLGQRQEVISNSANKSSLKTTLSAPHLNQDETFDKCEKNKFETSVPDDWVTVEDDFISIYAVNQAYISSDGFFSPKSKINDGVLWLCYLRGNATKANVLKFMRGIETGAHVNMPEVTYVPVTDMQMVPLCSSGTMTVDGERIDMEPIRTSIIPSKARVMIRSPN